MSKNFLVVDPSEGEDVLRAFASPARVKVLKLLHVRGPMNVNEIAEALELPQSTVSSNMQILEEAGLVRTETQQARKGNQKICHSSFDEVLVMPSRKTRTPSTPTRSRWRCRSASTPAAKSRRPAACVPPEGIIGLLDVPDTFLDPDRMQAGLIWFTRGFVEYQFPNNAKLGATGNSSRSSSPWSCPPRCRARRRLAIGHHRCGQRHEIGTWTSPGDFGDKRGVYTPELVEAEGQPVWQAQELAGRRATAPMSTA